MAPVGAKQKTFYTLQLYDGLAIKWPRPVLPKVLESSEHWPGEHWHWPPTEITTINQLTFQDIQIKHSKSCAEQSLTSTLQKLLGSYSVVALTLVSYPNWKCCSKFLEICCKIEHNIQDRIFWFEHNTYIYTVCPKKDFSSLH